MYLKFDVILRIEFSGLVVLFDQIRRDDLGLIQVESVLIDQDRHRVLRVQLEELRLPRVAGQRVHEVVLEIEPHDAADDGVGPERGRDVGTPQLTSRHY